MVELEKPGFDTAAFLASADQWSLLDSRRRKHHQSLASRNNTHPYRSGQPAPRNHTQTRAITERAVVSRCRD
jgi:hypothetical protein